MARYSVLDNEHASGDPLALLARLAAYEPLCGDDPSPPIWYYCIYCGAGVEGDDECQHDAACPWRLAREYCDRFLAT